MAVTIMNKILQVVVLVQHNLNIDVELKPNMLMIHFVTIQLR